jgi:putative nucleotidyltransferase with HDIG domain
MLTDDDNPLVEALLGDSRERLSQRLTRRERLASLGSCAAFAAVVVAMIALLPAGTAFAPLTAVLLVAAHTVAERVEFEIGAGYTVATQLVLVPMLLLLPVTWVPLVVLAATLLGQVPDLVLGRKRPGRVLINLPGAWHAVGPALVLALAGAPRPSVALLPLYALALGAQFAGDTLTGTAREWFALGVPPRLQARALAWVALVDALLAPVGLLAGLVAAEHPAAVLLVLPLVGLLALFAGDRRRGIDQALELQMAYRGTALLMSDMLEADDVYTGGEHSDGVVTMALAVAAELGMTGRELRNLEFGALLHDIGKIFVPKEILNKPGRLTREEFDVVKKHPVDGQELLQRIGGVLAEVGEIVRSHHERWDGGGYPDGRSGDAIPLGARIISACDAFSAMTTDRSYRPAMPIGDALAEMRRCTGTQFDAEVVATLLGIVSERERAGETPMPQAVELVLAEAR